MASGELLNQVGVCASGFVHLRPLKLAALIVTPLVRAQSPVPGFGPASPRQGSSCL